MAGVAVLIGPGALMGAHGELLGEIAVTCAALCYAVNGLVARRLPPMPVEVISAGCLLSRHPRLPAPEPGRRAAVAGNTVDTLSLAALVLLGVLNTAGGYLLLFRLVVRAGAGFSSLNNFLVPLFGVMWGVLLLDRSGRRRARIARPPADPRRPRRRATVARDAAPSANPPAPARPPSNRGRAAGPAPTRPRASAPRA